MTVQTLIRILSDHNPRSPVWITETGIAVGKDHHLSIPTKLDRIIEAEYEQLHGVKQV